MVTTCINLHVTRSQLPLTTDAYNMIFICTSGGAGLTVAADGVHLLSDYTGRASGEAFVHFVDKESAQEALNRDREKIGHRWGEKLLYFARGLSDNSWWGYGYIVRSSSRYEHKRVFIAFGNCFRHLSLDALSSYRHCNDFCLVL